MTEETKYFTPDISDVRVGYQCERLVHIVGEFDKELPPAEWVPNIIYNISGLDDNFL